MQANVQDNAHPDGVFMPPRDKTVDIGKIGLAARDQLVMKGEETFQGLGRNRDFTFLS
jgi:hypothetical protein